MDEVCNRPSIRLSVTSIDVPKTFAWTRIFGGNKLFKLSKDEKLNWLFWRSPLEEGGSWSENKNKNKIIHQKKKKLLYQICLQNKKCIWSSSNGIKPVKTL